ncbi:MAG: hypothetical protein AAGA25_05635 [Planctomycetota bacterium]
MHFFRALLFFLVTLLATPSAFSEPVQSITKPPVLRDFLGLNTHTVQFKPERYDGLVEKLRDYHPVHWDLEDDTALLPPFPLAKNRVDWQKVYGSWNAAGYDPHVCLIFTRMPAKAWDDLERDVETYGRYVAQVFGPNGKYPLISSVGVGNEPGQFTDDEYQRLFVAMASGLRSADPDLLITTCATQTGPSDKYSKNIELFKDHPELYDVITIHTYAQAEGWPTWKRSFPEDPSIEYLTRLRDLLAWRDAHAPGKAVWVCEYGWDASTKQPEPSGTFAKWQDVSDLQQAQYLVRSAMVFMREGVDRAYIYFFDDKDEPKVHAAAGLMRNGKPKMSWFAVRHLQQTLGDYRFHETLSKEPHGVYAYAFQHAEDPTQEIVVAWMATGSGKERSVKIEVGKRKITAAELMPTSEAPAESVAFKQAGEHLRLKLGESPVFLRCEPNP